ncbi:DUF5919 domain-containing protein [Nonomuraea rubra]
MVLAFGSGLLMLTRLRDRLDTTAAQRLELHVDDETIRFNLLIADQALRVVQPHLPQARGVDSPTFVINTTLPQRGCPHLRPGVQRYVGAE